MDFVPSVAKFLVAAVGVAVTLGLLDPGVAQTVAGAVTALAVYLVPNQPA
jgi:hypothetical protein